MTNSETVSQLASRDRVSLGEVMRSSSTTSIQSSDSSNNRIEAEPDAVKRELRVLRHNLFIQKAKKLLPGCSESSSHTFVEAQARRLFEHAIRKPCGVQRRRHPRVLASLLEALPGAALLILAPLVVLLWHFAVFVLLVLASGCIVLMNCLTFLVAPPKLWLHLSRQSLRPFRRTAALLSYPFTQHIRAELARAVQKTASMPPASPHDEGLDPRKEVNVRMIVAHLKGIDAKAHTFKAEVLVEATWVDDHRMAAWAVQGFPSHMSLQRALNAKGSVLAQHIWTPELYFENLVSVDTGTMRSERVGSNIVERWWKVQGTIGGKPLLCCRMRVVGAFATKFNLSYFPVDRQVDPSPDPVPTHASPRATLAPLSRLFRQELNVVLRSHQPAHTIHLCLPRDLLKYNSVCRLDNFVYADEWKVARGLTAFESRSSDTDTLNIPPVVYPELQFCVRIARKWQVCAVTKPYTYGAIQ
jgi:hypothetical protein